MHVHCMSVMQVDKMQAGAKYEGFDQATLQQLSEISCISGTVHWLKSYEMHL